MGRPRLRYLKQVARNTAADSYTTMKRMACNNSRWKAANLSKDRGVRRRRRRRRRRRKEKERRRKNKKEKERKRRRKIKTKRKKEKGKEEKEKEEK